jgi:hypothetical protein
MHTSGRRCFSSADGSGCVISSLTRRFVARSVADRDEPTMNAKQLLGLFIEVPGRLENAHVRLDKAVFTAYGWPPDLSDEEVLQYLLTLYLERSSPHLGR